MVLANQSLCNSVEQLWPWMFASCCVYEIRFRDFRLRNDISVGFTIYFSAAACFGYTAIFKRKYICS
jgi:hypothetical protein